MRSREVDEFLDQALARAMTKAIRRKVATHSSVTRFENLTKTDMEALIISSIKAGPNRTDLHSLQGKHRGRYSKLGNIISVSETTPNTLSTKLFLSPSYPLSAYFHLRLRLEDNPNSSPILRFVTKSLSNLAMQQGDYSSFFQYPHLQNPNPNPNPPIDHHQTPYASAPPFSSDYSIYPPNYPPYSQNSDPVPPPTAPTYTPTTPTTPPPNPNNSQSSFNPPQPLPPQQPPSFPPYDSHGSYQPPATQQSYFPPFDQHQTASNYAPQPPPPTSQIAPNPIATTNSPYSSTYSAPYNPIGSSVPPVYDTPYENPVKFDQNYGYLDSYNRSRSDIGSDLYGKRPESRYDIGGGRDDGYGDGVYAYEGGKVEPYGARGTAPKSSTWAGFDDYGRSISVPSGKDNSARSSSGSGSGKIVRAVPKVEAQEDVKSGVQKFRVKLLAESGGQSTMDVLCQIGLDGIRMLDPNTSRTLRIYPLENITRCDKTDSSTFAFWSKSSVDIEPRRIRLQSNSYTTNTLLDTVTAATVQLLSSGSISVSNTEAKNRGMNDESILKEMVERIRPSDASKTTEQPTEKKKGFGDWMNLMKQGSEEKDHWVPDEAVSKCTSCRTDFGAFVRRHHCRNCGDIFCDKCTHGRIALTADENAQPVRVCDRCLAEVTQRLSNAKEATSKPAAIRSHEDLAKKLQEEMEKNRKSSSGSKSEGSGKRMREVACPTCTVHLQVRNPSLIWFRFPALALKLSSVEYVNTHFLSVHTDSCRVFLNILEGSYSSGMELVHD
ncbi:unnamed protein product [Dovyalis caffra]|uniref:FYVE-type domain-containing protein n=1 Tax=Dovyalis caffra TaxID=77055 RepID=A0AAV1S3Z1_9ROSI|nr:unnamed protein product [Dovyalis caffra]